MRLRLKFFCYLYFLRILYVLCCGFSFIIVGKRKDLRILGIFLMNQIFLVDVNVFTFLVDDFICGYRNFGFCRIEGIILVIVGLYKQIKFLQILSVIVNRSLWNIIWEKFIGINIVGYRVQFSLVDQLFVGFKLYVRWIFDYLFMDRFLWYFLCQFRSFFYLYCVRYF